MDDRNKRSRFFPTNKYQKRILNLVFIPTLLISLLVSSLLLLFFNSMVDVIVNQSAAQTIRDISDWAVVIFASLWIVVVLILFWAYYASLHLVGPFDRVLREMDEAIEKKDKRMIRVRSKDDLANELLKRINILIKNI